MRLRQRLDRLERERAKRRKKTSDHIAKLMKLKTEEARIAYLSGLDKEEFEEARQQLQKSIDDLWSAMKPVVDAILEWYQAVWKVWQPIIEAIDDP